MQILGMPIKQFHPISQLLLLAGMGIFFGAFVGSFGLLIGSWITDYPLSPDADAVSFVENIRFFQIAQVFASLGAFLIPVYIMKKIMQEPESPAELRLPVKGIVWLLIVILVIFMAPITSFLYELNKQMHLPSAFATIENWMRSKEEAAETLTQQLLQMHSLTDLGINLIVIAALPALAEEMLFRGWVQTILFRWFGSIHTAVWVSAVVFSAFHMQFYGFLPRMILGAIFGYIFIFTGNMFLVILAHAVNNALAVLWAYGEQNWQWPQSEVLNENFAGLQNLLVFLFCLGIIVFVKNKRNQQMPALLLPKMHERRTLD